MKSVALDSSSDLVNIMLILDTVNGRRERRDTIVSVLRFSFFSWDLKKRKLFVRTEKDILGLPKNGVAVGLMNLS